MKEKTGKNKAIRVGVIVWIFAAIVPVVAAMPLLAEDAADTGSGGEKLLFGFEKSECERAGATFKGIKSPFKALENGTLHLKPKLSSNTSMATMSGVTTMEIVHGESSQGKYALRVPGPDAGVGGRRFDRYFYAYPGVAYLELALDPRVNIRLPDIFNTSNWYEGVFPADWSAYDLLRVDVKVVHDRPVIILVEVEDHLVEPAVSLTYEGIKPNAWVTLELDLRKAVDERKLDLSKMVNIFMRFDGRKDTMELGVRGARKKFPILDRVAVYVDNIRLSRKGTVCKTPVLKGQRSAYTQELPRSYGAKLVWERKKGMTMGVTISRESLPEPAKLESETEAVALSEPAIIDLPPLLKKGLIGKKHKRVTEDMLHQLVTLKGIVAADSKAMLVCFGVVGSAKAMKFDKPQMVDFGNVSCPIVAVMTTDGGTSWGGFAGAGEVPTWLHKGRKTWEGSVFDGGVDLMGLHDEGCITWRTVYEFYPGDRVYFWRTVYTGGTWKECSTRFFVSGDPRFCAHSFQDVLRLPSGRLWCMNSVRNRHGRTQAWAKYSDDQGMTWQSWRGTGFVSTVPLWNAGRGHLFAYGEHVGMIAKKGKFVYFDGKAWIEGPVAPVKLPTRVVTCGETIYVTDDKGTLFQYNGTAWKPLNLPGREEYPRFFRRQAGIGSGEYSTRQYFSVCGDTVLFVEVDKTEKKLLCWRKPKGGAWTGPKELVSEETPIADVVAPRYCLAAFIPVAYNCWSDEQKQSTPFSRSLRRELKPWIKVLQVPAGK